MNRRIVVLAAGILICASAAFAAPPLLRYQGRLVRDGVAATGTTDVTFRIFDAFEDGNLLFSESQRLELLEGVYAAEIGSVAPLDPLIFTEHETVYLELEFDGQVMTPRERIVSVAYALTSGFAQQAAVAQRLADAETLDGSDNQVQHIGQTTNASFHAHRNYSNQSIGTEGEYKVTWQVAEFNEGLGFDLANSRFMAPVAGCYHFSASALFDQGITPGRLGKIGLFRNTSDRLAVFVERAPTAGAFTVAVSRNVVLEVGDTIEVYVEHSDSKSLRIGGAPYHTFFSGFLVHQ